MLDGQHRLPARLPARASSPRRLWPPCPLRQPPVDPFQQIAELRRRDRHGSIRVLARCRRRPHEPATLQPLGKQAQALSVVPQNLDQSAAAAAEYEQVAGVGVALERLLHQQRQAIKAFAHIGMAARQPNLHPGGESPHRRRPPPPPPPTHQAFAKLGWPPPPPNPPPRRGGAPPPPPAARQRRDRRAQS